MLNKQDQVNALQWVFFSLFFFFLVQIALPICAKDLKEKVK